MLAMVLVFSTQHATDLGYAPRFLSFFVALGFSRFDGDSRPTHGPSPGCYATGTPANFAGQAASRSAAEILKSVLIKTEPNCGEKPYVKRTRSAQCVKR